jgi:hypothetical protein
MDVPVAASKLRSNVSRFHSSLAIITLAEMQRSLQGLLGSVGLPC